MKTLFFECNMGAAGDMLMAALYEVCDQKELFLTTMNQIFAPLQITVEAEHATKCGIGGTHMCVSVHGGEEGVSPRSSHAVHSMTLHDSIKNAAPKNKVLPGSSAETAPVPEDLSVEAGKPDDGLSDAHSHDHEKEHADDHSHDQQGHHHADDHSHDQQGHHHTDYRSIRARIDSLPLPDAVKLAAGSVYEILGEAEAKVHETDLEQIHFHEVGTLDAVADVVGCALLIHLIAPDQIFASPIHLGSGFVRCAHGVLPVPAPATAEILKGIPCYTGSIAGELCTPTGAAILKYYVHKFFSMPAMTPQAIGYGMGKKDFDIANCVRVFLGETFIEETPDWQDPPAYAPAPEPAAADPTAAAGEKPAGEPQTARPISQALSQQITQQIAEEEFGDGFPSDDSVLAISCNIDDMTGEAIGLATEILMAAGALDVYTIPIQMKKSRPGTLLTCICRPEERDKFTGLFFLHTSTRGIRYQVYERSTLESTFVTRPTAYGNIRIKKSSGYGIEKEKPEFEDLKSVVLKNGCSLSLDDVARTLRQK